MVHATVVYITNDDDGSVRTTTIFNDLPSGMTPPSTNAAGTHTVQVTMETARNEFSTFDLAYPTELLMQDVAYTWAGVVPTSNPFGEFTCSTNTKGATVDLVDYTAPISTVTTDTANPTDKAGLFYTLWNYHCQVGPLLSAPPLGNQNDGAIQYCNTTQAVCGAVALSSVQFLTETGTSHEKNKKPPSTSAAPTKASEPATTSPATTKPSTKATPAPVLNPSEPASTSKARSTTKAEQTTRPANTPRPATQDQSTRLPTPIVVPDADEDTEEARPQTQVVTLKMEHTGSGPTTTETVGAVTVVISEQMTITRDDAVYVISPGATDATATTQHVGDAIAGGLGLSSGSSESSSGASSSSTAGSQFQGSASASSISWWLLGSCSLYMMYFSLM